MDQERGTQDRREAKPAAAGLLIPSLAGPRKKKVFMVSFWTLATRLGVSSKPKWHGHSFQSSKKDSQLCGALPFQDGRLSRPESMTRPLTPEGIAWMCAGEELHHGTA